MLLCCRLNLWYVAKGKKIRKEYGERVRSPGGPSTHIIVYAGFSLAVDVMCPRDPYHQPYRAGLYSTRSSSNSRMRKWPSNINSPDFVPYSHSLIRSFVVYVLRGAELVHLGGRDPTKDSGALLPFGTSNN